MSSLRLSHYAFSGKTKVWAYWLHYHEQQGSVMKLSGLVSGYWPNWEPSSLDKSFVILSYNPNLIHSHVYHMSLSRLQSLSSSNTVPDTFPNGHILLRHHLVDHNAPSPQDCREVCQREHAYTVTDLASAFSISMMPLLEVVSRQWNVILLHRPASIDLSSLRYPCQGRDDSFICDEGKLGPLWKVEMSYISIWFGWTVPINSWATGWFKRKSANDRGSFQALAPLYMTSPKGGGVWGPEAFILCLSFDLYWNLILCRLRFGIGKLSV